MVHKPKHKVHSFRATLGDGLQGKINLERENVNMAYRIVKFQIMPLSPGVATQEIVAKVFREEQPSVTGTVDFSDQDLLGAAIFAQSADSFNSYSTIIFDNTLFSRNLYVTMDDSQNAAGANYYIEIEEVPVTASTLMQLKLGVARKLNLSENPPEA